MITVAGVLHGLHADVHMSDLWLLRSHQTAAHRAPAHPQRGAASQVPLLQLRRHTAGAPQAPHAEHPYEGGGRLLNLPQAGLRPGPQGLRLS